MKLKKVIVLCLILCETFFLCSKASAATIPSAHTVAWGTVQNANRPLVKTDEEAEQLITEFVANNINDNMTTVEKLSKIAEFVAGYKYGNKQDEWLTLIEEYEVPHGGVLFIGQGDCAGMAGLVAEIAKKAGFEVGIRDSSYDVGASPSHVNALVYDCDDTYIIHASEGYSYTGFWKVVYAGKGYEYKQDEDIVSFIQYSGKKNEIDLADGLVDWENGPDAVTKILFGAIERSNTDLRKVTIPATVTYIEDLSNIYTNMVYVFEGDAPVFENNLVFYETNARVYYPKDNPTWTTEVMNSAFDDEALKNLGSERHSVEWIPYGEDGVVIKDISEATVIYNNKLTYNGELQRPIVAVKDGAKTLVEGTDYYIDWGHVVYPIIGTVTFDVYGIGDYYGEITECEFHISPEENDNNDIQEPVSLEECSVSLEKDSYVYDGKRKTPEVIVECEGHILTKDIDYQVRYTNNLNAGTATVKVEGTGLYTGTSCKTFKISKSKLTFSLKNAYTYSGKRIKPKVTVYAGSTKFSEKQYDIEYSSNKTIGRAKITISVKDSKYKDNYKTTSKYFNIVPPKVKSISVKSPDKGKLKVQFKKVKGSITGYQIAYSRNKKSGFKKVEVKARTLSKTIKNLKRKKYYYVKVRAYKTVGKTRYYGTYSSLKKVRIK